MRIKKVIKTIDFRQTFLGENQATDRLPLNSNPKATTELPCLEGHGNRKWLIDNGHGKIIFMKK